MDALGRKGGTGTEYELAGEHVWITIGDVSLRIARRRDERGEFVHVQAFRLNHEDEDEPAYEEALSFGTAAPFNG